MFPALLIKAFVKVKFRRFACRGSAGKMPFFLTEFVIFESWHTIQVEISKKIKNTFLEIHPDKVLFFV